MTWGASFNQECIKCGKFDQCYVRRVFWNLTNILTSVDQMPDGKTINSGNIHVTCNGYAELSEKVTK